MRQPLDPDLVRETATRLAQIQEACREYVVQSDAARKMTFASIRISADAVLALCEDVAEDDVVEEVRAGVNQIQAAVDGLAERFGSDQAGRCRVCGELLVTSSLYGGDELAYCTNCPTPILGAVRSISDATGAEAL